MSLDLVKALKAPVTAQNWIIKMLIGGILLCIPVANFIVFGYFVKYIKKIMNNEENLPEFSDWGALFVSGLKLFVGAIVLAIPMVIIVSIISAVFAKAQVVAVVLNYIIQILYSFVGLIMIANFSLDEKILSMIDFKRAALLVKDNALLPFIGKIIIIDVIFLVLTIVFCITVVGVILVPFLMFAMLAAVYNLIAQFAKDAPKLEEAKAAASV